MGDVSSALPLISRMALCNSAFSNFKSFNSFPYYTLSLSYLSTTLSNSPFPTFAALNATNNR